MRNELRISIESLARRPYASEKLLLKAIDRLGLKAEIIGQEVNRMCYVLYPYNNTDEPPVTYYPCFEMRVKPAEGPGKVLTGSGFWW